MIHIHYSEYNHYNVYILYSRYIPGLIDSLVHHKYPSFTIARLLIIY